MGKTKKLLLDVDTGVDDSLAIIYGLLKKDAEIVGISTVCGNVEAYLAAENTLKILELMDAPHIPVVVGREAPLQGEWEGRVTFIHGDNGIGNAKLPKCGREPLAEDVSDFYLRLAKEYAGELTLVTLGPLTNAAVTLRKYPEFAKLIKNVAMMGGTLQTSGNVSPVSEANFYMDPAACDEVFRSGMDITVIGLDVTTKTRLRREHIQWLDTVCRPEARPAYAYLCSALEHYWTGNRIQNYCVGDCPVHDPLTMMAVMVPSLIKTQKRKARIECGGTYCRGMVVTDLREHPFEAEYVNFAVEVDQDRAIRELLSVFWEE